MSIFSKWEVINDINFYCFQTFLYQKFMYSFTEMKIIYDYLSTDNGRLLFELGERGSKTG